MSKYIATRAIRGANSLVTEAEIMLSKAMAEKGIDMAFRVPQSIDAALAWGQPEVIVTMGCGEQCPAVPGAQHQDWDLPDPAGQPPEAMRAVRDDVEARVKLLIRTLSE